MKQFIAFFTVITLIIISTTLFAILRNQSMNENTTQNSLVSVEEKNQYSYQSNHLPFTITSTNVLEVYDKDGLSTPEQEMSSVKAGVRYGMDIGNEGSGIAGVSTDFEAIGEGVPYEYINSFSIDGNNIRLNFPNANSLETLITNKMTVGEATLYFFENEQILSASGPLAVIKITENIHNIESLGFYAESESELKKRLEGIQIRITQ